MNRYNSLCDDFYVNMNLSTENDRPANRQTVLHFFERVQNLPHHEEFLLPGTGATSSWKKTRTVGIPVEHHRTPPGLFGLRQSGRGSTMRCGSTNWSSISRPICFLGLDCGALDLLYRFRFAYSGNHNELIAEALGVGSAMDRILESAGGTVINCEPSITVALDEECRVQFRLSMETRSTAYHVRTGEYPEEQLSVYVTARQYGSLAAERAYVETVRHLRQICEDMLENHVIEHVRNPLPRTIAMK